MLSNFRTYKMALELYKRCQKLKLPYYLKDQILRASSSVALNLGEGTGKPTKKDRLRFYSIAFGSLREVQSVLDLIECKDEALIDHCDHMAACLFKLTRQ